VSMGMTMQGQLSVPALAVRRLIRLHVVPQTVYFREAATVVAVKMIQLAVASEQSHPLYSPLPFQRATPHPLLQIYPLCCQLAIQLFHKPLVPLTSQHLPPPIYQQISPLYPPPMSQPLNSLVLRLVFRQHLPLWLPLEYHR